MTYYLVLLGVVVSLCLLDKTVTGQNAVTIPGFRGTAHRVSSGDVTIVDTHTVRIKNFHYDGSAPDVYFWVGRGRPSRNGKQIPDERGVSDKLNGYNGKDIELALPNDISVKDIDYISVWCKRYGTNFGHVTIPKNLNVPVYRRAG
ncbi:protein Skeletor, isoforms B/C [Folsomia candida]|nr:protein Skeletor, isoforms B/C [Folsomia candida]